MLPAIGSGVQAMKAIGTRFSATAHNVANVNTDGFKTQDAVLVEGLPRTGPEVHVAEKEKLPVQRPDLPEEGKGKDSRILPSETDLAREMTLTIRDTAGYAANARQLRTADDMLGSLLSIRE